MKRQRENILNQPTVKKPDLSASTDLRSKIGAKLQTLLLANRVETLRRRQAFLLGEPEHYSEIIIDPTIVVKTEAPETEECNEHSADIDSSNFLLSAKSRITELLNKQQGGSNKFKNCEKENSNSSSETHPVSSVNSATSSSDSLQSQTSCSFQSLSCNSLNKRKKLSNNKNCPDGSSDAMKNRTRRTHSLSSKSVSETCTLSPESSAKTKNFSLDKQRKSKAAKDHEVNEVSNSSAACDIDICAIVDDSTSLSESCRNRNSGSSNLSCNNLKFNNSKSKSSGSSRSSTSVSLDDCGLYSDVVDLGEILIGSGEASNLYANHSEEDSELVDDPELQDKIIDEDRSISSDNEILNNESEDPEVVILCVKRPTHEVITLEDADDSDDVIEEVHKCTQCGKAFRAKSLLNFHIRMHGSDISSSSKSSSIR